VVNGIAIPVGLSGVKANALGSNLVEFVLPAYTKFYEIDYPFAAASMEFYGANLRQQAYELSQGAPVNYMPPEFQESMGIMEALLFQVLEGDLTPQEALDKAAEQFQELLDAR